MLQRLGTVLWWFGVILGVGAFSFACWMSSTVPVHYGHVAQEDVVLGAYLGVPPIVIGWVCRYVLSGETTLGVQTLKRYLGLGSFQLLFFGLILLGNFYPEQIKAAAPIIQAAPVWVWALALVPVTLVIMIFCEGYRLSCRNVVTTCLELQAHPVNDDRLTREIYRKAIVKNVRAAFIFYWARNLAPIAAALVAAWIVLR